MPKVRRVIRDIKRTANVSRREVFVAAQEIKKNRKDSYPTQINPSDMNPFGVRLEPASGLNDSDFTVTESSKRGYK